MSMKRNLPKKRSWLAIAQPRDAQQTDAASFTVLDCWTSHSDRNGAIEEANERLAEWLSAHPDCKISLFEGDLSSQHFSPSPAA